MLLGALALFGFVVFRSAWLSDDAYITFRTVDNLLSGYGLRWNVIERVQTFTHPLWMLLVAAATLALQDYYFYFTSLWLSIACSIAAVAWLGFRLAADRLAAVLALLILMFSKAFVDYSTSGLENPLTHLLLAIFLGVYFSSGRSPGRILGLTLVTALVLIDRMDAVLLLLPALALAAFEQRGAGVTRRLAIGLSPFLAWECFSLVYYGFPFPNTAYAKLFTGIPRLELLRQGAFYFANSLAMDRVTLPAIAVGLWLAARSRDRSQRAVALGVVLYLAYVAWIGGDFMSGRFLTPPLLASVVLIARRPLSGRAFAIGAVVAIGAGLLSPFPPPLARPDYGLELRSALDAHGIADERQFYYPGSGLLSPQRTSPIPAHRYVHDAVLARQGPDVQVLDTVGMHGFFLGPKIHVIDTYGLCDPLTARLPTRRDLPWRIGHFQRAIPEGYRASARAARSGIVDRKLAQYDDALRLITRGPLFGADRWRAIMAMNLGRDQHLIDRQRYRFPPADDGERPAEPARP